MPVSIIYNVGGGGGGDSLDEFQDSVFALTTAATTIDLDGPEGLIEDSTHDWDEDTVEVAPVVAKDTNANMGAAALALLEGWWHAPGYSGSGNFLNSGTLGSALDLQLGAATAAPSFSTDHFVFDGVNDYMFCVDADQFEIGDRESLTMGIIWVPVTSVVDGSRLISKRGAGNTGWALQVSTASPVAAAAVAGTSYATQGNNVSVAHSVKVMSATVFNRGTMFTLGRSYKSVGGTLTASSDSGTVQVGSMANAENIVIGASASLGNFCKMDVYGIFLTKKHLMSATLTAIAAYYGV